MKHTQFFTLALCCMAIAFGGTSCKKDNESAASGEKMVISAEINMSENGDGTKTDLNGVNGSVSWSANDKFCLYSGSATSTQAGKEFTISEGVGRKMATFTGEKPVGDAPYYAFYPSGHSLTGAKTFTYTVNETTSFEESIGNAGPMAGYSQNGKTIQFKNVMSWLRIGLKGTAVVKKVVLTDHSTQNNALNGTLTVTLNDNGSVASTSMAAGTNQQTVLVENEVGVQLKTNEFTYFMFLVPAGSLNGTGAVSLDVYDLNDALLHGFTNQTLAGGVLMDRLYHISVSNQIDPLPTLPPTVAVGCATCNGFTCVTDVTSVQEGTLTKVGFCWAAGADLDPTTIVKGENNYYEEAATAFGTYNIGIADASIAQNTTYSVRTYTINSNNGIEYSENAAVANTVSTSQPSMTFTDKLGYTDSDAPYTTKPFSVNAQGKKVIFSKGNLQYRASDQNWQFADNQYDVKESNNANISDTYNGWIDLFGWGTSGANTGNAYFHPYDYEAVNTQQNYGPRGCIYNAESASFVESIEFSLTGGYSDADWGIYNSATPADGNGKWRVLTSDEWNYLLNGRSGKRYYKAVVNGVCGIIIVPDAYLNADITYPDDHSHALVDANNQEGFPNEISKPDFKNWIQNVYGCAFLPANYYRIGKTLKTSDEQYQGKQSNGYYWSASYDATELNYAKYMSFRSHAVKYDDQTQRCYGLGVRLVRDVN